MELVFYEAFTGFLNNKLKKNLFHMPECYVLEYGTELPSVDRQNCIGRELLLDSDPLVYMCQEPTAV